MAAKGFRAALSRMFGRALSEGLKAATKPAPNRPASTEPASRSGRSGRSSGRAAKPKPGPPRPTPSSRPAPSGRSTQPIRTTGGYPGDFTGVAKLQYAPQADGQPDPGEVVWAWVPFEEDYSQGKDRPVLVIARNGAGLLGLMLTSKDHDRDHEQEARHGRQWLDLGPGAWDRENRPSEARLDRILQLDPAAVRREGAVLDQAMFNQVAAGVRRAKGW